MNNTFQKYFDKIIRFFNELQEEGYNKIDRVKELTMEHKFFEAANEIDKLAHGESNNNLANQFFLVSDDLSLIEKIKNEIDAS